MTEEEKQDFWGSKPADKVWAIGRPHKNDAKYMLCAKFIWRNAIILVLILMVIVFGVVLL